MKYIRRAGALVEDTIANETNFLPVLDDKCVVTAVDKYVDTVTQGLIEAIAGHCRSYADHNQKWIIHHDHG